MKDLFFKIAGVCLIIISVGMYSYSFYNLGAVDTRLNLLTVKDINPAVSLICHDMAKKEYDEAKAGIKMYNELIILEDKYK